jgi:hypothetical protein
VTMVKRVLKTTLFGSLISVVLLKLFALEFITEFLLRVFSPLGVKFDGLELAQIIFVSLTTAIIAVYLVMRKKQ